MSKFSEASKKISSLKPTSLIKYIKMEDILFVGVLLSALFKDLSDIFISLIPFIGFILSFIISVLCAIFIFLVMFLLGAGETRSLAKRTLLLAISTAADAVPVVNFFPIETAAVIIAFLLILDDRKKKAEERKRMEELEIQQIYAQSYA